jgi:N-acetyl sugar amidotransferase
MTQAPLPQRHQVCTVTVMDTTDPDISFDEDGVCNYVHEHAKFIKSLPSREERARQLEANVAQIKRQGAGKEHDCILGLSGGVDSSYMVYLAKEWGLRPLVVHFDNGWNSELAVKNIEQMVTRLGFDLDTYVIDWASFRELQKGYFRAGVVDIEIPTDHLIFAALHEKCVEHGIKVILSGHNAQSEWLLPKSWYFNKFDLRNMVDINRKHGKGLLAKLPKLGVWQQFWYHHAHCIRTVYPLQFIDYDKEKAKTFLIEELGWRDYGGKHHESVFTRFYQGYVLPRKFGFDKRKAHLSSLILSGQLNRQEALRELQQPPYDPDMQEEDKAYVAKKLGFSEEEFEKILSASPVSHYEFETDDADRALYFRIAYAWGRLRRIGGWHKRQEFFL